METITLDARQYDSRGQRFAFTVRIGGRLVSCEMPAQALEKLAGHKLEPDDPLHVFDIWESDILAAVAAKEASLKTTQAECIDVDAASFA